MNTWIEWIQTNLLKNIPETYQIPDNEKWIKSLEEFYKLYKRKDWKLDQRYKTVEDFLLKIKELQYKDPIIYLHYFHFSLQNWFSAENLLKELQNIWFTNYTNKKSIYALFTNTLKWNWFNKDIYTRKTTKNCRKDNAIENPNHINNKRKELQKDEIDKLYNEFKNKTHNLLFLDLDKKKTLNQKIIYILANIWIIKKEKEEELAHFIKEYQNKNIWFLKTAQIIKWVIIKIIPEIWQTINEESLKKRLRERYNKYYK